MLLLQSRIPQPFFIRQYLFKRELSIRSEAVRDTKTYNANHLCATLINPKRACLSQRVFRGGHGNICAEHKSPADDDDIFQFCEPSVFLDVCGKHFAATKRIP